MVVEGLAAAAVGSAAEEEACPERILAKSASMMVDSRSYRKSLPTVPNLAITHRHAMAAPLKKHMQKHSAQSFWHTATGTLASNTTETRPFFNRESHSQQVARDNSNSG